jgi:phage gpG-like protein
VDTAALPAYLRALHDVAAGAVAPAATAMAKEFRGRVANVTLKETAHPPGQFWKAFDGRPPAYASGNLARSIKVTPAAGTTVRARAFVGAYANYAGIQERGGFTWPRNSAYMHWVNSQGPWWKKRVFIPAHPFFEPTVRDMTWDGSLSRAAGAAFYWEIRTFFQ